MLNPVALSLLAITGLLGLWLIAHVLREVRSPVLLRRAHLAAGAGALLAVLRAVAAVPPLAVSSGHLQAGFVACAFALGLLLLVVARTLRQGLTIVLTLHVCAGCCGVILAAAWLLRPA